MVALGRKAPDFALSDTEGNSVSLADFGSAKALVVIFLCNHCPYVKHIRQGLADFAKDYSGTGAAIVGINSNDAERYPADRPEAMREERKSAGYVFPYLYDPTQSVAKAYDATCTPDFFLFDADKMLVYRGQFDDSRPGNGKPVTGADLRAALDALLIGNAVSDLQKPSVGCNIKWR